MKKSQRILLVVLLAALALAACGGPSYNLYGTWRSSTGDLTLIFQQDGHLIAQSQGMVQNVLFTLSGTDTITIKPFDNAPEAQIVEYKYSIQGETLSLVVEVAGQDATQPAQTQTLSLTRVK